MPQLRQPSLCKRARSAWVIVSPADLPKRLAIAARRAVSGIVTAVCGEAAGFGALGPLTAFGSGCGS